MATQIRTYTADEFLALPNDGTHRELVDGEIIEMTPAGLEHGVIAARLTVRLGAHVYAQKLGELVVAEGSFRLSTGPDTVRVPDLSFIRRERIEESGLTPGFMNGAPDLAVEVISPTDRYSDVWRKVAEYLEAGTSMVLLVDPPNRKVWVQRAGHAPVEVDESGTVDGADVVPGWTLKVRDLFA